MYDFQFPTELSCPSRFFAWASRDSPNTVTPVETAHLLFQENQSVAVSLNRMEKEG